MESSASSGGETAEKVLASLRQRRERVEEAGVSISDRSAGREIEDRSLIASTVTTVFLVALPLALSFLFVLSFFQNANQDAIAAIADILKSVLMPIMTLVLGYYFGRGRG
jgi:type VI protein secretion system component VasF